ncbi:hypothetical protein DQ04_06101010 [Trypanosoma grayi]|uniref:hypothetical protein n=1 Tax=Trypanosoma grayi TaxID=71804 RepID=UPI0004F45266|nr:hypothetical protein DQ04_06101010 [Trypanosoma grayi]KEG08958.1 hypothetical protein DQ04_06101010 [Trypanosoma grayi]
MRHGRCALARRRFPKVDFMLLRSSAYAARMAVSLENPNHTRRHERVCSRRNGTAAAPSPAALTCCTSVSETRGTSSTCFTPDGMSPPLSGLLALPPFDAASPRFQKGDDAGVCHA